MLKLFFDHLLEEFDVRIVQQQEGRDDYNHGDENVNQQMASGEN